MKSGWAALNLMQWERSETWQLGFSYGYYELCHSRNWVSMGPGEWDDTERPKLKRWSCR